MHHFAGRESRANHLAPMTNAPLSIVNIQNVDIKFNITTIQFRLKESWLQEATIQPLQKTS